MHLLSHLAWKGMMPKDNIDAAEVNRALAGSNSAARAASAGNRFAGYVTHVASIDSTNRAALEAAQQGARSGVWVADEQTAGRGRAGHAWHSSPGDGLYVSALVAPELPAQRAIDLALATGLASQQAIDESCGLRVDLRWPNDLMLNGRKCAGILVETAAEASASPSGVQPVALLRYAVIGIGINVNHTAFPTELQPIATSLRLEYGGALVGEFGLPLARQPLLIALLRALDNQIALLEQETRGPRHDSRKDLHHDPGKYPHHDPGLLARFTAASTWVRGKRVHVPEQGGYTGTTAGLDPSGFLLVDADDGRQRTVLSGGVREL
jgi:BirA family biotin operon repressor/biotin-[acetyl-CoA-carboxylase] ligase